MKRMLLEVSFVNEPAVPLFVYRHCSTIPAYKLERLAKKLKMSFLGLLLKGLSKIVSDDFFDKKFEVKIVKGKVIFSFYYPEDSLSQKLSTQIVHEYEKVLRKMLKKS